MKLSAAVRAASWRSLSRWRAGPARLLIGNPPPASASACVHVLAVRSTAYCFRAMKPDTGSSALNQISGWKVSPRTLPPARSVTTNLHCDDQPMPPQQALHGGVQRRQDRHHIRLSLRPVPRGSAWTPNRGHHGTLALPGRGQFAAASRACDCSRRVAALM